MRENLVNKNEIEELKKELEKYKKEKEKIRLILGEIGGKKTKKGDKIINIVFIVLLAGLFVVDIAGYFNPSWKILPTALSIEIGVLLVSLKIIWMIHKQMKVEHFQFWILTSIEFRLNELLNIIKNQQSDEE